MRETDKRGKRARENGMDAAVDVSGYGGWLKNVGKYMISH